MKIVGQGIIVQKYIKGWTILVSVHFLELVYFILNVYLLKVLIRSSQKCYLFERKLVFKN